MSIEPASQSHSPPRPSALTTLLNAADVAKTPQNALAIQVLHNLQHQHSWTDLQLHMSRPATSTSPAATPSSESLHVSSNPNASTPLPLPMISGRPPKPLYIHPDVQAYMIKNRIKEADIPVEVEWVLPMSIGEKWTLRRFAEVFNSLPEREPLDWIQEGQIRCQTPSSNRHAEQGNGEVTNGTISQEYQDAKRVLMAMLAHAGMGGDGTITYYVMQEGDVKPRQN